MNIQLELWQFISLIITLVGAFWALAKVIASQAKGQIDTSLANMAAQVTKLDESTRHVERQLSEFQIEVAKNYTRREDHIQAIATIKTTIDALALNVQNMFKDLLLKMQEPRK